MRVIDADALIGVLHNVTFEDGTDREIVYQCIELAPTIEERKTGKWIWVGDEKYRDYSTGNATYKCSLCYHTDLRSRMQKVPYCWWCGAKMEVDE